MWAKSGSAGTESKLIQVWRRARSVFTDDSTMASKTLDKVEGRSEIGLKSVMKGLDFLGTGMTLATFQKDEKVRNLTVKEKM